MTARDEYSWQRWPEAEALIEEQLDRFLAAHDEACSLAMEMERQASTRLFDWLDHIVVRADGSFVQRAEAVGFVSEEVEAPAGMVVLAHPGAQLPRVVVENGAAGPDPVTAAIKTDAISDFLLVRGLHATVEGSPLSPYRVTALWPRNERRVLLVERRGYRGLVPQRVATDYATRYLTAREMWATRPRLTDDEPQGMAGTLELTRRLVADMGQDTAAWIVFEVERDYWQRRNWAGQVQKARQDRLGLGWANHDHHTFRSSRATFAGLVAILETLGFVCRERFYQGEDAGWGAQVMEQPRCGLVVFADVDLESDEVAGDFAHEGLEPATKLGTIGLWCALHGESILGAGMHHLEAQFEFDRLRDDLDAMGVGMMKPFSDMPHLRQAFTKGERWRVPLPRLERLRDAGAITLEQYETFARDGAVGSHLENLQRREGFKGFNQHNVSTIIKATDPRKAVPA